ncbi:MAG: hypothetical protein ACW97P_11960 [Candidatus Hodarchaeales archaeon]|jgi:hypothetical protein
MSIKDENYLKAALETIDLILSLLDHFNQIQTLDNFHDTLMQIEAKAEKEINKETTVSTELKKMLEIDLPVPEKDNKSSMYWQGVRDLTRIIIKQWINGNRDFLTLQESILKIKAKLIEKLPHKDISRLEEILGELDEIDEPDEPTKDKDPSPAIPYITNPPPPPGGMSKAIEKVKVAPEITEIVNESLPRIETKTNTLQPLAKKILDETEEEDEILSQSLRSALKILRDEE